MAGTFQFQTLDGNPVTDFNLGFSLVGASAGAGGFDGIDDPARFHLLGFGELSAAASAVFVPLALHTGQSIDLDLDFTPGNLRLLVLDAAGNIRGSSTSTAADDGSPGGGDPKLDFIAPATGIYYVVVADADAIYRGRFRFDAGGDAIGTFQLDISTATLPTAIGLSNGADTVVDLDREDRRYLCLDGNDSVTLAFGGNDFIDGGRGNDFLQTDAGDDLIDGGGGNDFVVAGDGRDVVFGKSGNDDLRLFRGDDQGFGGIGNDRIDGGDGNDLISGGAGDDALNGGLGDDNIVGGDGTDSISFGFSSSAVLVNLARFFARGEGNDRVSGVENVTGSTLADSIVGNGANNVLFGGSGDDILAAGAGDDYVFAGAGDDRVDGGLGGDTLDYSFLSAGPVTVSLNRGRAGGEGRDSISGIENLVGTPFDDILIGNASANALAGLAGNDTLSGLGGGDTLTGGEGFDRLFGGDGVDTLFGNEGADSLNGERGADKLDGGNESDRLNGGEGRDELTGGAELDAFLFFKATDSGLGVDADVITDFSSDLINLVAMDANEVQPGDQSFFFIGDELFIPGSSLGRLRAFQLTAANQTVVAGDTDGDGLANFEIVVNGLVALAARDFAL